MPKPKRGLGKGLEALFADNETADVAVSTLSINEIEPNAQQPRRDFSSEELSKLAESIKEHGILQPLVVRPRPNGRYQIVAGERRWRAARIAGLLELPVVVKELNDEESFEIALVENLIRADLNPVEEAMGYKTLMEQFAMTQEKVAQRVGCSRPAVANALRLLSLPNDIVAMLKQGEISSGHARALLSLTEAQALELAQKIKSQGLSVRQTEQLARQISKAPEAAKAVQTPAPVFYKEMELALNEAMSRKVKVNHKGNGKGELVIEFYSDDELREIGKKLAE